jgi:hypothetical protein
MVRTAQKPKRLLAFVWGGALVGWWGTEGCIGPEPIFADLGEGGTVGEASVPSDGSAVGDASTSPDGDAGPGLEAGARDSSTDALPALDSGAPDAAQVLYDGLAEPRGITLFGGDVCWVGGSQNPRGLFCAPKSGGTATDIVEIDEPNDGPLLGDAFDLVRDATYVYWSNGGNNQVVRKQLPSGQSQPYFSGGGRISFLTAGSAATLWATDFADPPTVSFGEVIVGPAPNSSSSNAIYTSESGASGVAIFGGTVFWGTSDALKSGPLTGSVTPNITMSPEMPVGGVAVDTQGTAYFLAGNQKVYRLTKGTAVPQSIYEENTAFGTGDVAVDDQRVYLSEPDVGVIMSIPK